MSISPGVTYNPDTSTVFDAAAGSIAARHRRNPAILDRHVTDGTHPVPRVDHVAALEEEIVSGGCAGLDDRQPQQQHSQSYHACSLSLFEQNPGTVSRRGGALSNGRGTVSWQPEPRLPGDERVDFRREGRRAGVSPGSQTPTLRYKAICD